MARIVKMLVPVDGSPPSIAALEHAVALAADGEAKLEVLHVEAPDEFELGSTAPLAPSARADEANEMDAAIRRAQERLGPRLVRRTEVGEPLRKIIETASEGAHDLIVIGTHGRVGRLHALLGSVAEGVVRSAPCPVLTVRDAGGEYQSFAERLHGTASLAEQTRPHHPVR
jgi:nucleotide-binding universal stress UspA family protein